MNTNNIAKDIGFGMDHLVVEVDGERYFGERYFVKDMANRQSEFIFSTQSQERVSRLENEVLFNTALALLNGSGTGLAEFNLVTGLPVDEYRKCKSVLKDKLQGKHVARLLCNGHIDGKKMTINKCR